VLATSHVRDDECQRGVSVFETFNVARENLINSRRVRDRNRRKSRLDQTWESDIKIAGHHSSIDFYLWACVKEIACGITKSLQLRNNIIRARVHTRVCDPLTR